MSGPKRPDRGDEGPSPWRSSSEGRGHSAPGAPGREPRWATAAKDGVGTALDTPTSASGRVWFTIARGVVTEVFYPRLDTACSRELGLFVADGHGDDFGSDEATDAEHRVESPFEGVPLYRLVNTCRRGRYRIEKEILAHPRQAAILQRTRFEPIGGGPGEHRLYALLNPHMANTGGGDAAWLGDYKGTPMLFARSGGDTLALACSTPWLDGSAGFVGVSDGRHDLARHGRLAHRYERAESGNVGLVGEVDPQATGGRFTLALGFGRDPDEAGHRARASLLDDFDEVRDEYVRGWRAYQSALKPTPPPADGGRDLSRASTLVLRTHADKSMPGATIASASTPWGEARGDAPGPGTEGYHMVWPRDLCEAAGGLLAVGAGDEAAQILAYLRTTQMADGHWPQNMRVTGETVWSGIQLGETAVPVLLLDHLRRERALDDEQADRFWPMARRAVEYILKSGPSTQQDRWEDATGYTPFTLSLVVAALLAAADMADRRGEAVAAAYLRETADTWNASVEGWLYVTGTDLARRIGVDGYYARIIPSDSEGGPMPKAGKDANLKSSQPVGIPPEEVVSPDFLAFVRYGLRQADDPRIVDTLKVVDAVLKAETPSGPAWLRYTGDGYGEHADGSPFDGKTHGVGRAWPLLTGERAHYELRAGRKGEAIKLLAAMAAFANGIGLIPEQVWDAPDIPEKHLYRGRPSGSAMPLVWAHAEYLKLCRSLKDGRVFDRPPQPSRRYLEQRIGSDKALWRFDHHGPSIPAGKVLRVEVLAPALIRWTDDDWATREDVATRDSTLGAMPRS